MHCHFESALRALAFFKPYQLHHIHSIYATSTYRTATPAARLTQLWHEVLRFTDHERIFTETTFRGVVQRMLDDLAASHVEHVDLRIGPSIGRWAWMRTARDGLDVFADELSGRKDLSVAFLAGINFTKSPTELENIFAALRNDGHLVGRLAGLDLNFLPEDVPKFERHLGELRDFQDHGLKINVHLGELFGNDVSRHVLSRLVPNRIGHGVLLLDDDWLVDFVKDHDICLDMCPTSNTKLGVADWELESPAVRALQLGIPVSINTDDPLLFGTDIETELRKARLNDEQREAVIADSRKYRYGPS